MAMIYQASQMQTQNVNNNRKLALARKKGTNEGGGTFSIGKLDGFLSESRSSIDVNLPSGYDHASLQNDLNDLIGDSIQETFQLNRKWMFRTNRFLLFYIIGCVYYGYAEKWDFITSMYFITQTVSTVGYGNIFPTTTGGQTFTMFYMFAGILLIFSVVGDITGYVVKYMRKGYQKPRKLSQVSIIVRNTINALMWICILVMVLTFGALVFSINEGWTFHDGFYFACVTATSIGYGDLALQKKSSIWFNIFFILLSVSTTALALDKIGNVKRHIVEAEHDQQMNSIGLSPELLAAINKDSEKITKAEFILHMLQLDGKLDKQRDIDKWEERFKEFDFDHDGFLTMNDVHSYKKIVEKIDLGKISRKRPNKKKSILLKAAEETRDVFLETFKLKKIDENDEEEEGDMTTSPSVFETVSPLSKAENGEVGRTNSTERAGGSPKRNGSVLAVSPHGSLTKSNSLRDWDLKIEKENEMRRTSVSSAGSSPTAHSSVSSISSIQLQTPHASVQVHRNNSVTTVVNPAVSTNSTESAGSVSGPAASSPRNSDMTAKVAQRSVAMSAKHNSFRRTEDTTTNTSAVPSTFVPFNVGNDDDVQLEEK